MNSANTNEISFEIPDLSPLALTYEDSRYYRKNKPNLEIEEYYVDYPQQKVLSFDEL